MTPAYPHRAGVGVGIAHLRLLHSQSAREERGRAVTWRKCFRLSARGNCQAGKPASSDTFRKRFFRRDYFRRVKTASSITVTLSVQDARIAQCACVCRRRAFERDLVGELAIDPIDPGWVNTQIELLSRRSQLVRAAWQRSSPMSAPRAVGLLSGPLLRQLDRSDGGLRNGRGALLKRRIREETIILCHRTASMRAIFS